jgi:hypothetical protein
LLPEQPAVLRPGLLPIRDDLLRRRNLLHRGIVLLGGVLRSGTDLLR